MIQYSWEAFVFAYTTLCLTYLAKQPVKQFNFFFCMNLLQIIWSSPTQELEYDKCVLWVKQGKNKRKVPYKGVHLQGEKTFLWHYKNTLPYKSRVILGKKAWKVFKNLSTHEIAYWTFDHWIILCWHKQIYLKKGYFFPPFSLLWLEK